MAQNNFNDAEMREQRHAVTKAAPPAALGASMPSNMAASAAANVSRSVAEVQAAMLIARQFPRDEQHALDRIVNTFTRLSLCEVAQYEYSKGGSEVRGPSIRAVEAIAQHWGNVHCGVDEIEQRPGWSTVRAYAYDAESGFQDSKVFQVEHMRYTRSGSYRIEDPREIYEHIANQGARRKRACLLAVIPGDIVDAAMRQADVTLHTKAEVTPESLAKLIEAFASYGVTKEAIERRLQRHFDSMTPAQLVNLRKIYTSLRDGMSGAGDWFELDAGAQSATVATDTKSGAAKLKEAAAAAVKQKEEAAAAASAVERAIDTGAVSVTLEGVSAEAQAGTVNKEVVPPAGERPTLTKAHVLAKLNAAHAKKSRDKLDEAASEISLVVSVTEQKDLVETYRAHKKDLDA